MTQKLFLACLLSLVIQAVLFLLPQPVALGIAPPSFPSIPRCVNPTGTPPCYSTIQAAINASSYGEFIIVHAGIYTEHITMKNGVSLHGEGWDNTVINGNYSAAQPTVYVSDGITSSTVISGLQITGGGTGSTSVGGSGIAIWYASPTIVNTWVYSNTAHEGGGVFIRGGAPTFENVPAWNNRAYRGGGFYVDYGGPITITGNPLESLTNGTVLWNSSEDAGGGIFADGVGLNVSGIRFYWNTATSSTSGAGGGVYIQNSASNQVALTFNHIVGNSARNGGGIYAYNSSALSIVGNVIDSNTATYGGGTDLSQAAGLFQTNWVLGNLAEMGGGVSSSSGSAGLQINGNWFERNQASNGAGAAFWGDASPSVNANTFVTNTAFFGGAMYFAQSGVLTATNNIMARNVVTNAYGVAAGVQVYQAPVRLINNTIADNAGDGVYFDRAEGIVIVNNIISGNLNESVQMGTIYAPTVNYTVDYNDRFLGSGSHTDELSAGTHDVAVDPLFKAAGANLAEYYHIQPTSPVSTTAWLAWRPSKDIDGEWRLVCSSVSMGADQIPCPAWYINLPLIRK